MKNWIKSIIIILIIAIIGIGIGGMVWFLDLFPGQSHEELPGAFTLSSNADYPDDDGNFTLTWGAADGAVSYSLYRYSNYITVINSSLTTLATSITNLSYSLTGYTNGTYYFIVVAHNDQGDTLSNCHTVIVAIPPTWMTPGITGIPEERWIKIGLMGDKGELEGDQNYMGGYLAARRINSAGGITINGTTWAIAVAWEDTDEQAAVFSTSKAVAAAERMVYEQECDFAVGGFRTEPLLAYREPFMDNHIPFLITGAMTDIFCTDVLDNYARYKYTFRVSPYNSTYSAQALVTSVLGMYGYLQAIYGTDDIDHMGILAENLAWTEGIRTVVAVYINLVFGAGTCPASSVIAFDPQVSPTVMNSDLQQFEDDGCDVILIAISLGAGLTLTQQWAQAERPFLLFGSNVQAQTAGYWQNTGGACEWEIGSTTATRCNKTPTTIEVYDDFNNTFHEHPIYLGFGAYDAVSLIASVCEEMQSINPDVFIARMEDYTKANPRHGGAGGDPVAWWPSHDLVAGYPFAYDIWFQWQNGTKTLIPSFTSPAQYPSTLSPMGSLQIPDWFTWDVGP
jgi:branched-chain amino acid transport system substrate-binding protein